MNNRYVNNTLLLLQKRTYTHTNCNVDNPSLHEQTTTTNTINTTKTSKSTSIATHVLLLNDYVWGEEAAPTWDLPSQCGVPQCYRANGLNGFELEKQIWSSKLTSNQPCLSENSLQSLIQVIETKIPDNACVILSVGFGDAIHNELLPVTMKKNQTLITSTLNVIPSLFENQERNEEIIIIAYDGSMIDHYFRNNKAANAKYSKYLDKMHVIGVENVCEKYSKILSEACTQTYEEHMNFIQKMANKVDETIQANPNIKHIVVECTSQLQVVPILEQMQPNVNVIGLKKAVQIILDQKQ